MKDQLYREIYPVIKIRQYIQAVSVENISDDQLFNGTGLNYEMLNRSETRVSLYQEQQLIKNILRVSDNPNIAFDIGKYARISNFGLLGFALMCCENLGEAIRTGLRFWNITAPMQQDSWSEEGPYAVLKTENLLCLEEELVRFRIESG